MFNKDKYDGMIQIKNLGLNHFEEQIFGKDDIEGIRQFVEENEAEEYCLRNPNETSGKFFYVKNFEEIKEKLGEYDNQVLICVSFRPFSEDIVLLGDICVHKDDNIVDLTARTDENANHRNIYTEPEYNMHKSLDSDELWDVPGFSKLMGYISNYELYDVVVEFIVYSARVGNKKENVVILELRSEY